MRTLAGERTMVRIYFGESDKWHHQPLEVALLERLRREGFAGATVFRGVAGFGANSVIHTTHLLELSSDLPVVIEVVDREERLEKLWPILDEMMGDGLVTTEKVQAYEVSHAKSR
jgi:PII-like signaling protein